MMFSEVHDIRLLRLLPRTTAVLSAWDGKDLPHENVSAALTEDLTVGGRRKPRTRSATPYRPGGGSQVTSSARKGSTLSLGPYKGR